MTDKTNEQISLIQIEIENCDLGMTKAREADDRHEFDVESYNQAIFKEILIKLKTPPTKLVKALDDKWISVDKRTPDDSEPVLVYAPDCDIIGSVLIGCYYSPDVINDNQFKESWTVYDFNDSISDAFVTHWMEVPDYPK